MKACMPQIHNLFSLLTFLQTCNIEFITFCSAGAQITFKFKNIISTLYPDVHETCFPDLRGKRHLYIFSCHFFLSCILFNSTYMPSNIHWTVIRTAWRSIVEGSHCCAWNWCLPQSQLFLGHIWFVPCESKWPAK